MLAFILRRLLVLPLTAFLAGFLVFILLRLAAGDPVAALVGEHAAPQRAEEVRARLGLDRPWPQQFALWALAVLRLDLGESLVSGVPVATLLAQRLPATLGLAAFAFVLSVALALPFLLLVSRRGAASAAAGFGLAAVFSVPIFLWGYGLVWLFALRLDWLPSQGWPAGGFAGAPGAAFAHLVLPGLSLALVQAAFIVRLARPVLRATRSEAFVEAAQARGERAGSVLLRYRLRAAFPALLTASGLSLATLLGGVVVTESVFSLPGLGRLIAGAALNRDYPVVQGGILLFAGMVIVLNLVLDLLHAWADPRLRSGSLHARAPRIGRAF